MATSKQGERFREAIPVVTIIAVVALVFFRTIGFEFVNWDDDVFVLHWARFPNRGLWCVGSSTT